MLQFFRRKFWLQLGRRPASQFHRSQFLDLHLESLENRDLLAGIVTVNVRGNLLDIQGDDQANHVIVRQIGQSWRVLAGEPTTIVQGDTVVTNVRRLQVSLAGGDDRLVIDQLQVPGTVRVTGGSGDDSVVIRDASLGPLTISDDVGATQVSVTETIVNGRTQLTNRNGGFEGQFTASEFLGLVSTQVSRGDDDIVISNGTVIHGNLTRTTSNGDQSTLLQSGSQVQGTLRVIVDRNFSANVDVSSDSTVGRLIEPGPTILRNEVYANPDGVPLRADVYIPRSSGPHPAVLLIHGGYWRFGDKANMSAQANYLVERGYTVVSINYRLAPQSVFPAQVHDAKSAVRWMRDNSARLQIDPLRIAAYGYSAGAQLALLLGVTSRADGLDGPGIGANDTSSSVQAVIAGGAPTDFQDRDPNSRELAYYFGGTPAEVPHAYRDGSPVHWVTPGDAPTLFYFGTWDVVVDRSNAEQMLQTLRAAGVESEFHLLNQATHISAAADTRALEHVVNFLQQHLA